MTYGDYIRQMSDEDLAEFLAKSCHFGGLFRTENVSDAPDAYWFDDWLAFLNEEREPEHIKYTII